MLKIALIDDQEYWIMQVKNSIPVWVDYEFLYFPSYREAQNYDFDIALIDYYLDIDWVTWDKILPLINAKVKIWFSSVASKSEKIKEAWAAFSCQKLNDIKNPELEDIFLLILS